MRFSINKKNPKSKNYTSVVKREVVEVDNKVACIKSFVDKQVEYHTRFRVKFYHRSTKVLQQEMRYSN